MVEVNPDFLIFDVLAERPNALKEDFDHRNTRNIMSLNSIVKNEESHDGKFLTVSSVNDCGD